MYVGIAIICFEVVHAELFNGTFHQEFLLAGLALCGVAITQWGRKNGQD